MAVRTFWVQIETDEDNLGEEDMPVKSDMYRILRTEGKFGIIDIVDEKDIAEIVYI